MNIAPQKILFICYGNMCRNPMAEGLAKKSLNGRAHVESAGLAPSRDRATDETIKVMKDEYGIDISNHRTRAVSDIDVAPFDTLVALDTYVYSHLKRDRRIEILWDIHDPYGSGMDVYRECASHIRRCLEGLVKGMKEIPAAMSFQTNGRNLKSNLTLPLSCHSSGSGNLF